MKTLLTSNEFGLLVPSSNLTTPQVEFYLQVVTELVHDIAGISLEEGEVTQILKGNGSADLYLNKRPVQNIISISSNRGLQIEDVYINNYNTGIVKKFGEFYQGQDINESFLAGRTTSSEIVTISYKGGYIYPSESVKGNVPVMLKSACAGLINNMSVSLSNQNSLKSYSRDDVSYTYKSQLERDNEFLDSISRYVMK